MNSLLASSLKRSRRTRTRKLSIRRARDCPSTSTCSKPLHIIHEQTEEEEEDDEDDVEPESPFAYYFSSASDSACSSPTTNPSVTCARPPSRRWSVVTVADIQLAHPEPECSRNTSDLFFDADIFCSTPPRPAPLPPTAMPTSPITSEDEDEDFFIIPPMRSLPRRASTQPLFIVKKTPTPLPDLQLDASPSSQSSDLPELDAAAEDVLWTENDDDATWYTHELSSLFTLASPSESALPSARPDSVYVAPKLTRPTSKPLPSPPAPHPSAQLDPGCPRPHRQRSIPKRAPPPPPVIIVSPAALSPSSRPPPRSSVPDDIGMFDVELELASDTASLNSSAGSVYSQEEVSVPVGFDLPMRLPLSLPSSPIDLELDVATHLEGLALQRQRGELAPLVPPPLRSKWSSSTLSSLNRDQELARSPSSKLKFYFGAARRSGRSKSVSSTAVPPSPLPAQVPAKAHARGWSADSEWSARVRDASRGLRRQASRSSSSAASESSMDSTSSSGLRRKPIPVEMFIR